MNIAAYCRVSTDKEDQLNSLEAQKEFFSEYTKRTGDNLVRLYADEGISGTKIKNRKEFLRMMADAEHGLFDMVVVKDISRFARNTVDLLQNVRKLKALGIETQFLTANMTSMGNSEFVLTIFGALAQEESANTSKRVKFGKKMNAEKGRVPNIVYGYGVRLPPDYRGPVPEQMALLDVAEGDYLVFEHGPFDFETENSAVEAQMEQAMKCFDYSASGCCLDTSPGRIFYFYHDCERFWKYIRPVRRV